MKKTISLFIFVLMLVSVAGCTPDLPDPLPDAEAFYARDIKNIEGEAALLMLDHPMFSAITEGDSELLQIYRDFVSAYLDDIQVSAAGDGVTVYPRGRSATVRMEISFVDMPKLMVRADELAQIRHDEYMLKGKMPSERTDHLYLLESMLEVLASEEIERISGTQDVELAYDQETGWTVTNAQDLIASYIW